MLLQYWQSVSQLSLSQLHNPFAEEVRDLARSFLILQLGKPVMYVNVFPMCISCTRLRCAWLLAVSRVSHDRILSRHCRDPTQLLQATLVIVMHFYLAVSQLEPKLLATLTEYRPCFKACCCLYSFVLYFVNLLEICNDPNLMIHKSV